RLQEDDGAAGGKAPALELAAQTGTAARAASLPAPASKRVRKGPAAKGTKPVAMQAASDEDDWSEF
ncbi:hypothetical protein ACFONG_16850, partial [Uliginosibacterium paludis]